MIHIYNNRRITHFSRSDNEICRPSSNTNEILGQLLTSLYGRYQDDLQLSHENSSFVYESVEECNIHFHKIDLRRGSSFIDPPQWLISQEANINLQNKDDVYCFMYAITIALFNKEFGKNLARISQNLRLHSDIFSWYGIEHPASYENYETFERLISHIALKLLYIPFEEQNELPEYISNRNFDQKRSGNIVKNR